MTRYWPKIVLGAVIAQAVLLVIQAIIFLIILPTSGITHLSQIDSLDGFRRVEGALLAASWVHFLFSLAIAITAIDMFRQIRQRAPLIVRFLVAAILLWVCIFFIGHDLGFGLILWPAIAADPASTVFSKDLWLFNIRNVVFFAFGVLTVLDAHRQRISAPSVSAAI